MRQPLSISLCGVGADGDAVDITVAGGKTGIPLPNVYIAVAIECGMVGFAVTKAGRADTGAIAARQTTFGDIFPLCMPEIGKQGLIEIARWQPALLLLCGRVECGLGSVDLDKGEDGSEGVAEAVSDEEEFIGGVGNGGLECGGRPLFKRF